EERDRAVQPPRLPLSACRSVSLGWWNAYVFVSRANGRSLRLHPRSLFHFGGRRDRRRGGPARHLPRASRVAAAARLQPPEHGHSRLSSRGAGGRPPHPRSEEHTSELQSR